MNTRELSTFVSRRIDEHPDADEAGALRELWNMAHDQIDVTPPPWGYRDGPLPSPARLRMYPPPAKRVYLPGEVKNERALRELARQWSDHPDFEEWA